MSHIMSRVLRVKPRGTQRVRSITTAEKTKPIKRFYQEAGVRQVEGQWRMTLDSREFKTPRGSVLELPTQALAEAMAEEWARQEEHLRPAEMPMTTLACTAVDLTRPDPEAAVERMLPYLTTDTLCFEDDNEILAERQALLWGPMRGWFGQAFGVDLSVAQGILVPQHADGTLDIVRRQLLARNEWELCSIEVGTQYAKSLIIATALLDKPGFTAEEAFHLALLEEHFQIERWGLVEGEHDASHQEVNIWFGAIKSFASKLRVE